MKVSKNNKYSVAEYFRLSKEDEDVTSTSSKTESNSITNQKYLIEDFIKTIPKATVYDQYVDDGYSGSNFERPEFNRMMDDIYKGKVNMVIVKDLSRFGREYIDAGNYIQKIFPSLGIRFISVMDHFDSLTASSSDIHLLLPVKNFVNDNYCRDISVRVRSNQKVMREKGLYIGPYVAYGYKKDKNDKHKIVIDEYAAEIVRKIFNWKLTGVNVFSIVQKLNRLGVPSPMEYKKMQGINYKTNFSKGTKGKWCESTVYSILKNKIYIGVLEQGKRERVSYKIKKIVEKSEDEWNVIKNHHEAIISEIDFNKVEDISLRDTRRSSKMNEVYMFSGMIFCTECKAQMTKRTTRNKDRVYHSFICSTRNKNKGCSWHAVKENVIEEVVLLAIQNHIKLVGNIEEILKELDISAIKTETVIANNNEINSKLIELSNISKLISVLHDDVNEEIITQNEFIEYRKKYEMKMQGIESEIAELRNEMRKFALNDVKSMTWLSEIKKYRNVNKLSRLMVILLIDKIYYGEDKTITIKFRYQDGINNVLQMINTFSKEEEVM